MSTPERVDPPVSGVPDASSEIDEALLALRSGAWLTVIGVVILLVALALNQLGDPAERLDAGPTWWMLICVLVGQVGAVLAVEFGRGWIRRRCTAAGVYRYLWTTSVLEALGLAVGIVLLPAAVVQLSLTLLMMVIYAGYFYGRWQAISFMVCAVAASATAVAIATPPDPSMSMFTAAVIVPLAGVTLMAGVFVAVVRRGRDGVERRARIVATVGLAHALDLRDAYTADHSDTVAAYAAAMASELGLSRSHVERVRLAGLLHDVGKIGIPDAVLLKPGALTDDEWAQMRRHPELGAQMLDSTTLRDVRRWVLAHHERPDGRGYPEGLRGSDIPLEARILSVADAFEAMTSDRVYRAAMPVEDAVAELHRCAGTQFDPDVVAALVRTLPDTAPAHHVAAAA